MSKAKRTKKIVFGILKFTFALAALGYVLHKVKIDEIKTNILHSDFLYLFLAFMALNLATFIGSLRMKTYFGAKGMNLPESYAVIMYYIGMFFNTVLPGGIGGDAYIIVHLRHKFGFPALKIVRIILATRANGLFFLNLFFFTFAFLGHFDQAIPYLHWIIIGLFILQMPVYSLGARYIFAEDFNSFIKAGVLSAVSQIFSILTAYFAFRAVGINDHFIDYLTLYLAAAIVAVIPVTPGGVGLRELIFLKGSQLLGLDPRLAVAGSLIYFATYFVTSLSGLALYLFANKLGLENKEQTHGTDAHIAG